MKLIRFHQPEFWGVTPLDQLTNLRDELTRIFDWPIADCGRAELFNGWAPALDLREDKDSLVASVELPGLKKEDIDISVHDGVLSITGERSQERKAEAGTTYRTERFFGRFQRSVALPKTVKLEGIKAAYKDGLLTVTMPKTEEAKPKPIEVTVA